MVLWEYPAACGCTVAHVTMASEYHHGTLNGTLTYGSLGSTMSYETHVTGQEASGCVTCQWHHYLYSYWYFNLNSRCCCEETVPTSGWNLDIFNPHCTGNIANMQACATYWTASSVEKGRILHDRICVQTTLPISGMDEVWVKMILFTWPYEFCSF